MKMKKIINNINGLLKKYPEVLSVPAALVAWVLSVRFLRLIDQTTAVYDAGVFQVIIFAVIQLFVYVSVAWLTLGLDTPSMVAISTERTPPPFLDKTRIASR